MSDSEPRHILRPGDALIIVDVQPDFCPGGKLPIEEGDQVIPVLNEWVRAAEERSVPVYASRDWHPPKHLSFEEQGGDWPEHCVQDTDGAQFHPDLRLPADVTKISKGVRLDQDQYSAFDETGLAQHLRQHGVQRLWVGGLAQDVCVKATVLDGCRNGFEVHLIADATRPVNEENGHQAVTEMQQAGAQIEYAT